MLHSRLNLNIYWYAHLLNLSILYVCGMCKYINGKRLFSLHISGWLAPRGVSLISRITGFCSSYRNRLRGSVAFFFFSHLPLCTLKTTSLSRLPLLLYFSVHLSLASLLPHCYAGFPSLTRCQGTCIRVHPEICWRDLNRGMIHPQMAPFPSLHFRLWILGALMPVSPSYFSSPDEYYIILMDITF